MNKNNNTEIIVKKVNEYQMAINCLSEWMIQWAMIETTVGIQAALWISHSPR